MAKSLQEQLLASGVAKPKQAKKAKREKVRRDQAARRDGKTPDEKKALEAEIARAEAAKRERDRQLNASQKSERQEREQVQSATQIIDQHRIKAGRQKGDKGDNIAYSYTVGGKVRRIEVSPGQQRDLAAGRLAIVRHGDKTSLVPRAAAQRLPESWSDAIWLLSREQEAVVDPDDPYADFQVPDDMMW